MDLPMTTEGVRLAVEIGTPLLLDSPHVSGRYRALLAGLVPDRCVIVTRPAVRYQIGDSVLVRYFHGGSVYGFRSDVRAIVSHPVNLLVLGYPAQAWEQNLRGSPRLECTLPCRVSLAEPGEGDGTLEDADDAPPHPPLPGLLRDISREGCQVVLAADPPMAPALSAPVRISLWIPPQDAAFELTGRVRRLGAGAGQLELGIRFDVPAEEAYEQVRILLNPPGS